MELKLRELFDGFDREFIKWDVESFARIISQEIHREYQIKQKWDDQKFIIVPEMENHPLCHGCFNEFESCGTPCVTCDISDKINKEWKMIFMMPKKFRIYERTS